MPLMWCKQRLTGCPCAGTHEKDVFNEIMRALRMSIGIAVLVSAAGCANGGGGLTSPSPVAVPTPTVPSSCTVPAVPAGLSADVTGASVNLEWSSVGDAADYVVVVGWSPSSAETLLTNTPDVHHWIETLPSGTHFARVHAHNGCGTSPSSAAISFTVR